MEQYLQLFSRMIENIHTWKIKWDNVPVNPEDCKKFYDPFDVVKEIKMKYKEEKKKKVYENFYLKDKGVTDEKINQWKDKKLVNQYKFIVFVFMPIIDVCFFMQQIFWNSI